MKNITSLMVLILIAVAGTGCTFMQKWVTGTIFESGEMSPRQAPGIIQCAECGQGVRLDPNYVPDQKVVIYEHTTIPPLVSYGPNLSESRILGEGYTYPTHTRKVMVIKSEPSRPRGAFVVGGQWCDDLCYDCNKARMEEFQAKELSKAEQVTAYGEQILVFGL